MRNRLIDQINFILEVDKLKSIMRQNRITVDDRIENDAEHSWHIAIMAPLLAEHLPVEVDLLKVIKMLLIHDLVEIDAGDTFAFDEKGYVGKFERELEGAKRIFGMLPEDQGNELLELWVEFEKSISIEAKYAAVIDMMQPFILNFNTGARCWIDNNVTKTQVLNKFYVIQEVSKELWSYFLELLDYSIEKGFLIDK
ncbi:HD domain-containing protein [Clostridium paraputrificum]|uniref:HD domain-containing protein n=1 Tax=Clostridium paraputrificum TaxID=29363 RepID=UPI003D35261E